MPAFRTALLVAAMFLVPNESAALERWRIAMPDTAPEGLTGNGRAVVRVLAGGFAYHMGGKGSARLTMQLGGRSYALDSLRASAEFLPGGVLYRTRVAGEAIEILHGALPDVRYFVAARSTRTRAGQPALQAHGDAAPPLTPAGRDVPSSGGAGILATDPLPPDVSFESLYARLDARYRTGLVLETPDTLLDRAVPFCRALLDVGFDGRMHVCDIFRWRDVWSRDLGSGLAVGAMG